MNAMLSKYLKDFSAPEPPVQGPADDFFATGSDFDFPALDQPEEPQIDVEALCEDARREGYELATQELSARHDTEIATLMSVHAGEVDQMRADFERTVAERIEARLTDAAERLAADMASELATLMMPLVDDAVTRRSVDALAVTVRELVLKSGALDIVCRGPERLGRMLKDTLSDPSLKIRHAETEDIDLVVEIDRSIVSTRLAEWHQALSVASTATPGGEP